MKRKIIATTFTVLSLLVFSGCSSKEVTIEQKQPEKYEVLGKATGTGSGSMGIGPTAYNFIPLGLNEALPILEKESTRSIVNIF